jgi:CheY-like chemotaxis protein
VKSSNCRIKIKPVPALLPGCFRFARGGGAGRLGATAAARVAFEGVQAMALVLVVEDNAIAREGLAAVLRRHGYAVAAARDGQEALDLLASGLPADLILLDLVLPVLDGWGVLERLQSRPHGSATVVLTTGAPVGRRWAVGHGCAGILKKPFDEEELLAEIEWGLWQGGQPWPGPAVADK